MHDLVTESISCYREHLEHCDTLAEQFVLSGTSCMGLRANNECTSYAVGAAAASNAAPGGLSGSLGSHQSLSGHRLQRTEPSCPMLWPEHKTHTRTYKPEKRAGSGMSHALLCTSWQPQECTKTTARVQENKPKIAVRSSSQLSMLYAAHPGLHKLYHAQARSSRPIICDVQQHADGSFPWSVLMPDLITADDNISIRDMFHVLL